ncbi:MAG: hypothetical protein U5R49_18295 [Deltaproteobacteria bacterium]|nr:hypothetical protein [Deltaproteobacteria bacterium]
MTEKIFSKDEWTGVLKGLKDAYRVIAPVKDGDFHTFMLLETGKRPDFDYQNTRLSPKSLVYPESERMFEYSLDEADDDAYILKEAPKDYSPQAVVGIRPCDAHAFQIVKRNFDNPEYSDPYWVKHFESSTLIGLGCNSPCPTCFCTEVGGGPFHEQGLDALMIDRGETYLIKALTEKGEAFLKEASGGSPADEAALKEAEKLAASAEEKIQTSVPTDALKDKVATDLFDAPFWGKWPLPASIAGPVPTFAPPAGVSTSRTRF